MNIKQLRQRRADLLTANRDLIGLASKEERDLTPEEGVKFDATAADIKKVGVDIERVEALMDEERKIGRSLDPDPKAQPGQPPRFASFGEQLIAVANASKSMGHNTDPRLFAGPSGANEAIPSEGGFLVQHDYATGLLTRTYELGQILQRVQRIPISANSNGLKLNTVDESSRANGSRYGGIQVYRTEEAGAKAATKPKFGRLELNLKKITGLFYATDELLQDATALEAVISQAFPEEFSFKIEDEIIRGTGAGQMLGILNSACKVAVAKETGQEAKTIEYDNIVKMWARMWARSRGNAVWLVNQDVEPSLGALKLVIGTGGVPVYLPPGGLSGSPFGTLYGRPVIPVEYCETLGTEGDIILADFSQYLTIDKGGLQTASSIHVRFLNDETTFRFVYRNDGAPLWAAPLIPYKGTNTLSPFVTLAVRA